MIVLPATYENIATTTVSGSSTSTITFNSFPSTFTDLVLIVNAGVAVGSLDLNFKLNNDSSQLYSRTYLNGDGTSATSGRQARGVNVFGRFNYGGLLTTSIQQVTIAHFMNYSNTTTNKTVISRTNNAGEGVAALVNLYGSTSAITQIDIIINSSNFLAGSTFTLYGIRAAN